MLFYLSVRRQISLRHLPTFQVPATVADKLLGVVSSYRVYYCALLQIRGKTPCCAKYYLCAHLKVTGKCALGDALRASYNADPNKVKVSARKEYNKNQDPKRQPLMINIELNQIK